MIPSALRALGLVAALVAVLACASVERMPPDRAAAPAEDVPVAFLVVDGAGHRAPTPEDACRSPLVDPRNDTRLELVRSASGRGDYRVPAGRYGVPPGSLLRVECASGRPLGVVPERS